MRRWAPLLVAVLLTAAASAGGVVAGNWVAGQPGHPATSTPIDRSIGMAPLQLLHEACAPLMRGWHLTWGQPVRLDSCQPRLTQAAGTSPG